MQVRELSLNEIESIKTAMEIRINELSQLIRQASSVLSRFTKYTSMATTPQMKTSIIKAIRVIPIEPGKALVVIVTNAGIVRDLLAKLPENVLSETLIMISNVLNSKLSGLSIEQVNIKIIRDLEQEIGTSREVLLPILECAADCISQIDDPEVYLEGTTNMFNHPEFRDFIKAREFMSILDEKTNLSKLLEDSLDDVGITVRIGSENDISGMKECSVIKVNYNLGDTFIGSIGIIGPTRMEYPKVISSMNYIRKKVNEEIIRLIGVDTGDDG